MLKKHSKIKFFIFTVFAIIGIFLCVCPFAIPFSSNIFNAFIPSINKGIDLTGGVEVVYSCQQKEGAVNMDEALEDAQNKLYSLYSKEGYDEVYINKLGQDKIQILLSDEAPVADDIYTYVENASGLTMTLTQASDSLTEPLAYILPQNISTVAYSYDYEKQAYGITVSFTSKGLQNIEKMKEVGENDSTVYIYLGQVNANNLLTSVSIDEVKNQMFIYNTSKINSAYVAQEYAHNILAGSLNVSLTTERVVSVSAALGNNTELYISIALAIMVVASFVLLCVRYGHLGLLGSFSMVFYLIIFSFIMQAIPFAMVNLTGVVGCVIAYMIAILTHCYIFEKIREEYALGKKIHLACKGGFKKALWGVLDSHAAGLLASACIWVFAPAGVKILGIALFAGLIISVFVNLALTRYFVNLYLPLNSTRPNKMHLYRDKSVKEIKEEVEIIPEDQVNSQIVEGENE